MQSKEMLLREIKAFAHSNDMSFEEALAFYQIYALKSLEKCIADSFSDLMSTIDNK